MFYFFSRYPNHGHYGDDLNRKSRIRSQSFANRKIMGVTNNTKQHSEASRGNDQYDLEETVETRYKMDSSLRSVHRRWTRTTVEKYQNNHKGDWFDSRHQSDIHTRPQSSMNDVGWHDQNMEPILPIWSRHRKTSVYNAELPRKTSFTVQRHSMQTLSLADDDYVWKIPNPRRKSCRQRDQKRSLDPTLALIVEFQESRESHGGKYKAQTNEIQTPSMHDIKRKKESRHSQNNLTLCKRMESINTNPREETCEELEYHPMNQSPNDHSLMFNQGQNRSRAFSTGFQESEGRNRSKSFLIGFQKNFNPQSWPDGTETFSSPPMLREKTG